MSTPASRASGVGRAGRLAESVGEVRDGVLHLGGLSVGHLAELVGTPYFAYHGEAVEERIRAVREALGEGTDLYFSIKANPSLGLCQLIAGLGAGAELASIGELHLARAAGFPPGRVLFAGPGKTDEELEAAVRWGIQSVNVESAAEIARLEEVGRRFSSRVPVCLRVNPRDQVLGAQMRMGGGNTQFGIDEELLPETIARFGACQHVAIVGIHVYVGSQLVDVDALAAHHHDVLDIAEAVGGQLDRPLEIIDLGGGFAVPYFEGSHDFDLAAFASAFADVRRRHRLSPALAAAKLVIELGRYLVAEAGIYVTRVLDVKASRGVRYVVLDGGMNHHITATGNFGQVFRRPYPVAVLDRMDEECDAVAAVVGPCCTPLDAFGREIPVPADVKEGDLIGVFYSGAYGLSASSVGFLSHPTPAEVLVHRGRAHVLRPQGRADQVLDGQLPFAQP
jgi:diaminopimelate decarboxylase